MTLQLAVPAQAPLPIVKVNINGSIGFVLLRSVILLMLFIFEACNPRSMKWLTQARTRSWGPIPFGSTHPLSVARITQALRVG